MVATSLRRIISEILHEEISGDLLQTLRDGTVLIINDFDIDFMSPNRNDSTSSENGKMASKSKYLLVIYVI